MNHESAGICMSMKIAFESLQVACTGVIQVQFLIGEQVNRHRLSIA